MTCDRCHKPLTRRTAVQTRVGVLCQRHASRLPPYLYRTPKHAKKGTP